MARRPIQHHKSIPVRVSHPVQKLKLDSFSGVKLRNPHVSNSRIKNQIISNKIQLTVFGVC